ncbi:ABC transporter permease subunit [Virgibacillus halodenitrificans]|uniref:carbohydrate ABC transporter permease n=1 Tax=Virgibacillus halodenitrificans TaxID=1482 RepID=UPI00136FF65F|nr:carbohydrate ABC transporter permease [Virgibacillus halodenitrificans]MYL46702.1 ABC transporter permease subunit [Virgibacillus halodenitrificans]
MKHKKEYLNQSLLYVFLSIGVILSILPFYWMAIGSTLPSGKIFSVPPSFLPGNHLVENAKTLNESLDFLKVLWNSLFISVTYTIVSVLISSMAGYAFAKFEFKGKSSIFFIILCTLMIPFQVMLIPLFEIIVTLDWLNTYQAIILPTLASPFAIFLMRQNMLSIPMSIIESARIDGAGEFKIFFSIVLPTMKPAVAAVSIFLFMSQWNSLLWPLITLNSKEMFTLPVALSSLVGLARIDYGQLMLGTTLSVVPVLIFFLIFQKHFISGILGGSVKE